MVTTAPTLLDVMESRLGIQEIPGAKNNPVILEWFAAVGHPEIKSDETSWCSICVGSAAVEANLPIPAVNVNMMARSWLTWGVEVKPENIQPGDVAIWPRGDPKGWQGHVNVVKEVLPSGKIKCIGGNQSAPAGGGDAVTITKATDLKGALGFRRAVPATVADLRKAGSTEIKQADRVQNAGWLMTFVSSVVATIKSFLGPVEVPEFASVKESLDWWQMLLGGVNAVGKLVGAYPWLAGTTVVSLILIMAGRQLKARRLAKHVSGVPLSAEVAKLEGS